MKGNDILFIVGVIGLGIFVLIGNISNGPNNSRSSATSSPSSSTSRTIDEKPLTEKQIGTEVKKIEREVNEIAEDIETLEENKNASIYKGQITMSINGIGSTDPLKEYATLTASSKNKTPIKITGWQFRSLSTNNSVSIGKAYPLFFSQGGNAEQDVYLKPGEKAYISTGVSPMGMSFQVNKCSGYHSQFYSFSPSIPRQCPRAKDEKNSIPNSPVNDKCFDFIDSFPQCRTQVEALPVSFTGECRSFILDTMNYQSCITLHKNDADFYSKQWRIYLGRDESLWKKSRETVVLLDASGKIVATVTVN